MSTSSPLEMGAVVDEFLFARFLVTLHCDSKFELLLMVSSKLQYHVDYGLCFYLYHILTVPSFCMCHIYRSMNVMHQKYDEGNNCFKV